MASTIRELYEVYKVPLVPDNFVPQPGPCENQSLYFPHIEVPGHLMSAGKAKLASMALAECQGIVGMLGERETEFANPEFAKPAAVFNEITGVDIRGVFALAFNQLYDPDPHV